MPTPTQLSFFDLTTRYEALSHQGDPFEHWRICALGRTSGRPWQKFSAAPSGKKAVGLLSMPCMLKVLVLQALYNLSDDQTEYQIRDRLSFMRFLGLDLDQRIPDAKTIWLFRETLAQAHVVETLFAQFETYLAKHGLQPRGGQLIDASLVPVPKQRNTQKENALIKAGECPTEWESQPGKRRQKDTDARWTVKHGENHYGYKNHVNVDKKHKLIRQYAVTDAAVHDSQVLEAVLLPAEAGRGYLGRLGLSLRGNRSAASSQAPALEDSPKRVSQPSLDDSTEGRQPRPLSNSRARRTCLRPSGHRDGRQIGSHHRADSSSLQGWDEESHL